MQILKTFKRSKHVDILLLVFLNDYVHMTKYNTVVPKKKNVGEMDAITK